jgi:hypothetical protein
VGAIKQQQVIRGRLRLRESVGAGGGCSKEVSAALPAPSAKVNFSIMLAVDRKALINFGRIT